MDLFDYPYYLITHNTSLSPGFESKALAGTHESASENLSGENIIFIGYNRNSNNNTDRLGFPEKKIIPVQKSFSLNLEDIEITEIPPLKIRATVSKAEYLSNVYELKKRIQAGDIYEINYCICFEAENAIINPLNIFRRLQQISTAPYAALAKLKHQYIISSSPELFLSGRENKLVTKPIKGTAKRGLNTAEDNSIKETLFRSLKERTENVMIVDVCRNDLSRISSKGTVAVEKLYDIESYLQVHQMVSTISCELKTGVSFGNIMEATFPMASMTGAPKVKAMQIIDEAELYKRGPYSGCLGYSENNNFDLSVLIRSIFYDESKKYLSFTVGSAITHLCDPEQEYEECLLKANGLLKALNATIEN